MSWSASSDKNARWDVSTAWGFHLINARKAFVSIMPKRVANTRCHQHCVPQTFSRAREPWRKWLCTSIAAAPSKYSWTKRGLLVSLKNASGRPSQPSHLFDIASSWVAHQAVLFHKCWQSASVSYRATRGRSVELLLLLPLLLHNHQVHSARPCSKTSAGSAQVRSVKACPGGKISIFETAHPGSIKLGRVTENIDIKHGKGSNPQNVSHRLRK